MSLNTEHSFQKYLKYKAKYLQLKSIQVAGGSTWLRFIGYILEKDYKKAKSQLSGTPAFIEFKTEVVDKIMANSEIDPVAKQIDDANVSKFINNDTNLKLLKNSEKEFLADYTQDQQLCIKWAYQTYLTNIPQ